MRLPAFLVDALIRRAQRTPYSHLSGYMLRHWVRAPAPGRTWAIRLHQTLRSDHGRALHDHPWSNFSYVLRSGYWEVVPGSYQVAIEASGIAAGDNGLASHLVLSDPFLTRLHQTIISTDGKWIGRLERELFEDAGVFWRGPGAFVCRKAGALHRLVLPASTESWSLFGMKPKEREWGYATPQGWVHNKAYDGKILEVAGDPNDAIQAAGERAAAVATME